MMSADRRGKDLTANITHDKTAVITAPSWNGEEVEASFVLDEVDLPTLQQPASMDVD